MRVAGVVFLGFVLLDICTCQSCPPCPTIGECDSTAAVRAKDSKKCICQLCVNYCWDRFPRCKAGEYCELVPIECPDGYNCGRNPIMTATCKSPFTSCPTIDTGACSCPESGHLKDQNNCDSCLCMDPCKELKCADPTLCMSWSVTPGTEFNYECQ